MRTMRTICAQIFHFVFVAFNSTASCPSEMRSKLHGSAARAHCSSEIIRLTPSRNCTENDLDPG